MVELSELGIAGGIHRIAASIHQCSSLLHYCRSDRGSRPSSQSGFVGSPLKSSAHYFAATFSVVFWYPFGEQHVLPLLAVVLQFDRCSVAISVMTGPHRFVAWLSSVWVLLLECWPLQAAHEIVPTIFAH